jgi:hypothetical protein
MSGAKLSRIRKELAALSAKSARDLPLRRRLVGTKASVRYRSEVAVVLTATTPAHMTCSASQYLPRVLARLRTNVSA